MNRRWVRPLGWVIAVIGLLLIGFAGGQLLFPRTVVAPDRVVAVETESSPVAEAVATMPDLLGLTSDVVARVLADAGISSAVTTMTAPAAGPEGVVTEQVPTPGDEAIGGVTITLSESVATPELIGTQLSEARRLVESLGAVVHVTRDVDPTVADGTVLSIDPEAGEPLGPVLRVVVADAGDALSLSALPFAEPTSCRAVDSAMLNGIAVQDSVACRFDDGAAAGEWVLSRRVSALEATIGVSDRGDVGRAAVRVLGDGKVLAEATAAYGETTQVRVDLREVLRLRIEISAVDGEPVAVLGDARLLGTSEQLADLEASR